MPLLVNQLHGILRPLNLVEIDDSLCRDLPVRKRKNTESQ